MSRIAVVAVVVIVGGRLAWQTAQSHPYFTLRSVEIVGVDPVRIDEIRDVAGVSVGMSTWDVDLAEVRGRVLKHPWVANVSVRRRLPDGFIVGVREHRALAAVRLGEGAYAVDRRGFIFAPLAEEACDELPQITGVTEVDLSRRTEGALRQTAALIRILSRGRSVSEAHIDRRRGVTVRAADLLAVPIHFGWGDWKRKRKRLNDVLALWSGSESQLEDLNLAFGDQVVVRMRARVGAGWRHDIRDHGVLRSHGG